MNSAHLKSWLWVAGLMLTTAACATDVDPSDETGELSSTSLAVSKGHGDDQKKAIKRGKQKFNDVVAGVPSANNRACGTCHIEADAFALSPANVQARPASDPLFNVLDADDPNASVLTYNNLKAGLVRVTFTLPENIDLVNIPPVFSVLTPPDISAQILALWKASIVPGTRLGDPMPPDLDIGGGQVIHFIPEIITPPDRKISVWRAVPSIANTAYTAPFLFDGREDTLQGQALGALQAHSGFDPSVTLFNASKSLKKDLNDIAAFEQSIFSDDKRTRFIVDEIAKLGRYRDKDAEPDCNGRYPRCDPKAPSINCLSNIPDPEKVFPPTAGMSAAQKASWQAGKKVYDGACAGCHGTATDDRIKDRAIHDGIFFDLDADGNLIYEPREENGVIVQRPRNVARPDSEFINIGASFISHVGQIAGPAPAPNGFPLFNNQNGVVLPRYRLRFYTDGTRTTKIVDLPPLPVVSGGPAFTPAADPNKPGALIVGSNFGVQLFTTDPGRALISGDWADFEGFDVPQLRGIAKTAPYFHDHSQVDLPTMITTYSQLILPFLTQLDEEQFPPTVPGVDRLTETQKADLLTFLNVF